MEAHERTRREREERERADREAREVAERARQTFGAAYVPFDSAVSRSEAAPIVAVRPASKPNQPSASSQTQPTTQAPVEAAGAGKAPSTAAMARLANPTRANAGETQGPAADARPKNEPENPAGMPNGSVNGAASVVVQKPKPRIVQATVGLAAPLVQLVNEPAPAYLGKNERIIRWVLIGGIVFLVAWIGWRFVLKPLWQAEVCELDPFASTGNDYLDRQLGQGKYARRRP